jgi:hypothetical protein
MTNLQQFISKLSVCWTLLLIMMSHWARLAFWYGPVLGVWHSYHGACQFGLSLIGSGPTGTQPSCRPAPRPARSSYSDGGPGPPGCPSWGGPGPPACRPAAGSLRPCRVELEAAAGPLPPELRAGSRASEAARRKPRAGSRASEAARRKPCAAGSRASEAARGKPRDSAQQCHSATVPSRGYIATQPCYHAAVPPRSQSAQL